jgi:hypothetical protein
MLSLIENPYAKKIYRDLSKYYKSIGLINEAEAFESLIGALHEENDSTSIDKRIS